MDVKDTFVQGSEENEELKKLKKNWFLPVAENWIVSYSHSFVFQNNLKDHVLSLR